MLKPGIRAERNLILNGDFSQSLREWKRGPVNPAYVVTKAEQFESGERLNILSALDGSSAYQEITLFKSASNDVRYVISFLCEMDHDEEGLLELSVAGLPDTQKIPLRVGALRDRNADLQRQRDGLPRLFRPHTYEVDVTLPLLDTHVLKVHAISPLNKEGDYFSSLRITRINLQLHLPAAHVLTLQLDGEQLPLARVLPLCLGALGSTAHRFKCIHAQDDAWQGTRASLNIRNNPQGAIVADPDWGRDKPLDDTWSLVCPELDGDPPYLLTLQLANEFNSPVLDIPVSLGDHRLKFIQLQEAAHYVVMEYGQSIRVGVRVGSYYTDEALEGKTVTWTVDGTGAKTATPTDREGWAWFEQQPSAAGDVQIQASVESLYYASGAVSQAFEVKVLATDPLKEIRTIIGDGDERPWDQKGYPNRGTTYRLQIRFPEELWDTDVTLRWSGDPAEKLGVSVTPPLETAARIGSDGLLEYRFDNEDRDDGQFSLRLTSAHLLESSPAKPMLLARNVVEPGEVRGPDRICVVDENDSARMWVQVLHKMGSATGGPVEGALVFWTEPDGSVTKTLTGTGGWASHSHQPGAAGDHRVTATIKAHEDAEPSEMEFVVKAIATNVWKEHVKVTLDDEAVDLQTIGLVCRHGQTHVLKVTPVEGSPWVDTKRISLDWREGDPLIGLNPADPGIFFPLGADGLTWNLSSSAAESLSRPFELRLRADAVADDRELCGRFVNADLTRELGVRLDRVTAALDGQTLYPCLGADHQFTVWLNELSPLVGLSTALEWSGTPAEELNADVRPPLAQSQPLGAEGAFWQLDFRNSKKAGDFALAVNLPQLAFLAPVTPMDLGHNALSFNSILESPVDPVVDLDQAWTWANVVSRFTGEAVADVPVTWHSGAAPVVVNTDSDGNSGFAVLPVSTEMHTVQATLLSLYDTTSEHRSASFKALAEDLWPRVKVSFDGQTSQVWGDTTGFPRRKGRHSIVAFFPEGFNGQTVRMGHTGTAPAVLGNSYQPELGMAQVVTNGMARFGLRAGDFTDGSFALRLCAERLARLSPANAMSQGSGSRVIKIGLTASNADSQLLWGDVFEETIQVVSSISAKPMAGMLVTFTHPDLGALNAETDFYGRATVRFVPTTPGSSQVIATVGDAGSSASIALDLVLAQPRQIAELYEPSDARQPPDEPRVHAKARVTSALTGQPLAGVPVTWEFAGHVVSSVTDDEGIADWTFMGLSDGVLSATVEGGLAGWDMAVLTYTGQVPVIESLSCDRAMIYRADEVNAWAVVKLNPQGTPVTNLPVNWRYAGNSLPTSISDEYGIAPASFLAAEVGEFDLEAWLNPGTISLAKINVVARPSVILRSIYASPLIGQVGKPVTIAVQVVKNLTEPVVDMSVLWTVDDVPLRGTVSDDKGWSKVVFAPGETGSVVVRASVKNPVGTTQTSLTLVVV
ncbi:hypothetical protein ABIA54_003538 [Pseudomonas sp. EB276 TE3739]|uniref:hypothetical protein n=1 Tax=Pseudomonas TaxID=286 RepID=UPI0020A05435|nr:hypothetical protein [Pseudomonas koreensis]MCP1477616.1 hypothetical protein [Pseudomonas koreensis]